MGRRRIRGLKARVGRECCICRKGARLDSEGIQAGGVQRRSHSAVSRSRETAGGQLHE